MVKAVLNRNGIPLRAGLSGNTPAISVKVWTLNPVGNVQATSGLLQLPEFPCGFAVDFGYRGNLRLDSELARYDPRNAKGHVESQPCDNPNA